MPRIRNYMNDKGNPFSGSQFLVAHILTFHIITILARMLLSPLLALWGFSCCTLVHAQSQSCPVGGDASIVAMTGTPVGTEQVVDNSTSRAMDLLQAPTPISKRNNDINKLTRTHRLLVTMYVTMPNASLGITSVTNTAVLYLTDVFGINLTENRL